MERAESRKATITSSFNFYTAAEEVCMVVIIIMAIWTKIRYDARTDNGGGCDDFANDNDDDV